MPCPFSCNCRYLTRSKGVPPQKRNNAKYLTNGNEQRKPVSYTCDLFVPFCLYTTQTHSKTQPTKRFIIVLSLRVIYPEHRIT